MHVERLQRPKVSALVAADDQLGPLEALDFDHGRADGGRRADIQHARQLSFTFTSGSVWRRNDVTRSGFPTR